MVFYKPSAQLRKRGVVKTERQDIRNAFGAYSMNDKIGMQAYKEKTQERLGRMLQTRYVKECGRINMCQGEYVQKDRGKDGWRNVDKNVSYNAYRLSCSEDDDGDEMGHCHYVEYANLVLHVNLLSWRHM